jgi:glycosyltransferase involved in cell wall biosynthesis/SAM-dependent methyltransferase
MFNKTLKKYKKTRVGRPLILIVIEEFIVSWLWHRTKINRLFNFSLLNVSSKAEDEDLFEHHNNHYSSKHVDWVKNILEERGESLRGKRVLEIGPGGLLIRGLLFQGYGASYSALDAFEGGCLSKEAVNLYQRFISKTIKQDADLNNFDSSLMQIDELSYYQNTPIELAKDRLKNQQFDIIFSHGVFEHLFDIDNGITSCKELLVDGGLMIHNVDFHAHDFWRDFPNPHMHMTIPNSLYKIAYPKFRGYPNRLRHSDFVSSISHSGSDLIEIRDYDYYDNEVLEIRKKLPNEFAHYSDEDLLIQRVTYVCQNNNVKQKIKVAFIGDIGSSYRTGGGQTFASLLLEGIDKYWQGVEVNAFLYEKPIDRGTIASQVRKKISSKINIKLIRTPDYSIGHPLTDLNFIIKARKSIAALNADLYIFDQPNTMEMLLPKKPSIAIFHGNICSYINYHESSFHIPRLIKKVLWQQIFVKKVMLQYLRNEKNYIPLFNSFYSLNGSLGCIPNLDQQALVPLVFGLPVDGNRFFPSDELGLKFRERNGIQNDDIVITYVSNFAKKKLSNIVPEIITPLLKNKRIRIFIIGRSMDSEILDRFCEKNYNCFRITEIPNEDVNGYINMSNILFTTSKTETFGYTIVEGMLCCKPSVVFSEGAQVEYIDHGINGMIANTNGEFTQHLEQLISDEPLRQKLGQEARKTILKKFGLKNYMKKTSRIIEKNFELKLQ